jgi:hypothetical protein
MSLYLCLIKHRSIIWKRMLNYRYAHSETQRCIKVVFSFMSRPQDPLQKFQETGLTLRKREGSLTLPDIETRYPVHLISSPSTILAELHWLRAMWGKWQVNFHLFQTSALDGFQPHAWYHPVTVTTGYQFTCSMCILEPSYTHLCSLNWCCPTRSLRILVLPIKWAVE